MFRGETVAQEVRASLSHGGTQAPGLPDREYIRTYVLQTYWLEDMVVIPAKSKRMCVCVCVCYE